MRFFESGLRDAAQGCLTDAPMDSRNAPMSTVVQPTKSYREWYIELIAALQLTSHLYRCAILDIESTHPIHFTSAHESLSIAPAALLAPILDHSRLAIVPPLFDHGVEHVQSGTAIRLRIVLPL